MVARKLVLRFGGGDRLTRRDRGAAGLVAPRTFGFVVCAVLELVKRAGAVLAVWHKKATVFA